MQSTQAAHPIFTFADGELGPISGTLIRSIERFSGQPRIRKLYFDYVEEDRPYAGFWADALDKLNIDIDLRREAGARIPRSGPTLVIANHPYGVIDGLVLCALMAEVRPDYKIITHRVLKQAPATMDKILPIDFDETEAALATNIETRQEAAAYLRDGGAVIIFPAGAISLAPKLVGEAYDKEWKTFAAKLATQPNTVTVPFLFSGQNSLLFQAARKISLTLAYSLMFREICKLIGTTVSLTMRKPVHADDLAGLGNRKAVTQYLRDRTYGLH
ncbi:MAG: lysophospholipid acyltransferase family protein [Candidatus Puniceispirillaceae bacterium]